MPVLSKPKQSEGDVAGRPVNVGLVGAGVMGRIHARNLAFHLPGARLVAVADKNIGQAELCGDECGVEAAYTSCDELLGHPGLDAVVISTPRDTHGQLIEAAAAAGKHVFCEKPLESSLAAADRALAAVKAARVKLQLGFNRRFDTGFQRARDAIASGEIGRVFSLHIIARDPLRSAGSRAKPAGDLFFETTVHDLDMVSFLTGSEVTSLEALGGTMADAASETPDEPDTAVVLMRLASGAIATIDNSWLSAHGYDQRLEVFGSGGMVTVANQPAHSAEVHGPHGVTGPAPQPFFAERYAAAYVAELAAFVRCIVEDEEPPVTGEDGRAALVLALAAWHSYRQGRLVEVSEFARLPP